MVSHLFAVDLRSLALFRAGLASVMLMDLPCGRRGAMSVEAPSAAQVTVPPSERARQISGDGPPIAALHTRRRPDALLITLGSLLVLTLGLHVWSLLRYPPPYVDEPWILSRAQAWLRTGIPFGPLDVGVLDLLPGGYRVFGLTGTVLQALPLIGSDTVELWPARAEAMIAGVALLGVMFAIGRTLADARLGVLAALLTALSTPFFNSAHLARPEIFVAVLGYGALALQLHNARRRSHVLAVLGGAVLGLGADVHPNALLLIGPLGLLFVLDEGRAVLRRPHVWAFVLAAAVVAALPLAGRIMPDPHGYAANMRLLFGVDHLPPLFSLQPGVLARSPFEVARLIDATFEAGGPVWLACAVWLLYRRDRLAQQVSVIAIGVLFAFVLFVRSKKEFYALFFAPALDLVVAACLYQLLRHTQLRAPVRRTLLGVALLLVGAMLWAGVPPLERDGLEEYRQAQARIGAVVRTGESVMGCQQYWLGLQQHSFHSWEGLAYYTHAHPGTSLEAAFRVLLHALFSRLFRGAPLSLPGLPVARIVRGRRPHSPRTLRALRTHSRRLEGRLASHARPLCAVILHSPARRASSPPARVAWDAGLAWYDRGWCLPRRVLELSESPLALEPTVVAGRYAVGERLGAGGMGDVFRARDLVSGRSVAFKQLRLSEAGPMRRRFEALFEREYHTLVRLRHPHIIEVYDYGVTREGPYYTMELLDGADLLASAPLPYRQVCSHLRDIASSLALLHAHRLVHRDISPNNVRLTRDGRAKLIDFGALTAFGPSNETAGTPPCTAPEVMRKMPLDQRTDLYALGVVGYWALTRRLPYVAKRFSDLPAAWQTPPPPPSALQPEVPPELDALIAWLLNLDPLARPINAASVIDRLTAIGQLEPEDHEHAAESYLSSSRMVGRRNEQEWASRRIARALEGKGTQVVIEGAAGMGKTRLLHEIGLQAQLKGLLVAKADAQAAPLSFGVACQLALALLDVAPGLAERGARPSASLLAHLSDELRARLGNPELAELSIDPGERRMRFQTALHDWFRGVARERPLLIAVDNVHAADSNSVAFLTALGRQAEKSHIIVLVTQRAAVPLAAPIPLHLLRQRSGHLKLGALSLAACEELVRSIFGDVANTGRVARLLYDRSAGNPQHCIDLCQLMVRKQIAKYAVGTWVLPLDVDADELPNKGRELALLRTAELSPQARRLGEALSLESRPVSIDRCLAIAEGQRDGEVFGALDELVTTQIAVVEAGCYRFSQSGVRDAMAEQIDPARRRALHRRAGETLLAGAGQSVGVQIEAAWHLLRAGEDDRGADLMARASRLFLRQQGFDQSVEQVLPGALAAFAVYEQRRSDPELAGLLFPLITLAWFGDWRVMHRHIDRALDLGLRVTGLSLAQRLRPVLGGKVALGVGLGAAYARLAVAGKRDPDSGLPQLIASFCGALPPSAGLYSISLDVAGLAAMRTKLEPLSLFPRRSVVRLMYAFVHAQELLMLGRQSEALVLLEELKIRFREPDVLQSIGAGHYKALYGGLLYLMAAIEVFRGFGAAELALADDMDGLGVQSWTMAADQVRLLHHAYRGDSERVRYYRERAELVAVQGGTTWQTEMIWPALLIHADLLTGDAIALRRSAEQLARRARNVPSLAPHVLVAEAAYLVLRGDLAEAISRYESLMAVLPPHQSVNWLLVRGHFARALNATGQHARASRLSREALACSMAQDYGLAVLHLDTQCQLALAEAGLGRIDSAVAVVDGLLGQYGQADNPLLVGLLHQTRAEIALQAADPGGFERHFAETDRLFRGSNNPALLASLDRLIDRAIRRGLRHRTTGATQPYLEASESSRHTVLSLQYALDEHRVAHNRHQQALRLIVEHARARGGSLFAYVAGAMQLVAGSAPGPGPSELQTRLEELAVRHSFEEIDEGDDTRMVREARIELKTAVSRRSSGRRKRNSLQTPYAMSEEEPVTAIVSQSSEMERLISLRPPTPDAEPKSDPSDDDDDDEAIRTVFVASDRPGPDGAAQQWFLLRLPAQAPGIRDRVVGGLVLEMDAKELFRVDPEILAVIARTLSPG